MCGYSEDAKASLQTWHFFTEDVNVVSGNYLLALAVERRAQASPTPLVPAVWNGLTSSLGA